jgi:hypothetical protein
LLSSQEDSAIIEQGSKHNGTYIMGLVAAKPYPLKKTTLHPIETGTTYKGIINHIVLSSSYSVIQS